jgi:hypothetical protein
MQIDFEGSVDGKGYRLEQGRIIGNGGAKRRYRLRDFPTLYLIFAQTKQTPEGLLSFVNRFGRLMKDDGVEGDNVKAVLSDISLVSLILESLRPHKGKFPKFRGGPVEYEVPQFGIKVSGGIPIKGKLTAWLAPNPATGVWQLRLAPLTLLDAIWLQLGQAITSNATLRACDHCGKWFEAGQAAGRRADAKFCSDECRISFNSLKRSQHQ